MALTGYSVALKHNNHRHRTAITTGAQRSKYSMTERVLFIFDGKIAGERRFGTYEQDRGDLRAREESLAAWLTEMDF